MTRKLTREFEFAIPPMGLTADLCVPEAASGLVIFAHGSGSSRRSPRNREVAQGLVDAGLATLLFDLLTPDEASDRNTVFDIPLLATRLVHAIDWSHHQTETARLPIGLFGASTGAAAALVAAARVPDRVAAVVSRGGRPDLATDALPAVEAPVLLIVGAKDDIVIVLNMRAMHELHCTMRLEIVPGASHLFEEPGTLGAVTRLARDWFLAHLKKGSGL